MAAALPSSMASDMEEAEDREALLPQGSSGHGPRSWPFRLRCAGVAALICAAAAVAALGHSAQKPGLSQPGAGIEDPTAGLQLKEAAVATDDPVWGCGLVGHLRGITPDGQANEETRRLIEGMKYSSTFNKPTFWNWNFAPKRVHLTEDFIFMPENWGADVAPEEWVRPAGATDFLDSKGRVCKAEMANILLGMNEPDIKGSCMGNMFGKCAMPCDDASVASGDCPAARSDEGLPPALPNLKGQCNCWQFSHATGVGFWPLKGCQGAQPLPNLWQDPGCVATVMEKWKATAAIATRKGYKYLSTPLVAVDISYAQKFIEKACGCTGPGVCACTDASCGCPVYVGFHYYAYDCRPEHGGYDDFIYKIGNVSRIMELYPFVKGAIINEVGMLNCAPVSENPICVPDSGRHPASQVADHGCPNNGLATFLDKIFDFVIREKTKDGRSVVKAFSWFNENMKGGTYNLRVFHEDGTLNAVGESYIRNCQRWGESWRGSGTLAAPAAAAPVPVAAPVPAPAPAQPLVQPPVQLPAVPSAAPPQETKISAAIDMARHMADEANKAAQTAREAADTLAKLTAPPVEHAAG